MSEAADLRLVGAAREARALAYARYSRYAVGAALLCADGSVVTGANVENASYGLSMCAERVAVHAAVASGRTAFEAIAVAGPATADTPPCGACRQVLAEFGLATRVLYSTPHGYLATTVGELLPAGFALE